MPGAGELCIFLGAIAGGAVVLSTRPLACQPVNLSQQAGFVMEEIRRIKNQVVPEEELRKYYAENASRYAVAEERRLDQVFKDAWDGTLKPLPKPVFPFTPRTWSRSAASVR